MAIFEYTAKDQWGKVSSGQVEADNNGEAVQRLRDLGLWVTGLKRAAGSAGPGAGAAAGPAGGTGERLYPIWSGVSAKDRSLFYRQLAAMLNAGVAAFQALSTLARQTPNGRLRRATLAMAERTNAGGRISAVMREFPNIFTSMELRMLEMGEMGGMLVDVMNRLADYLEREYQLRLKIRQRMTYPFLVLLALIFIPDVPVLVLQGFPAYAMVVGFSWGPRILGCAIIFIVVRQMLRLEGFRNFYDQVKLALPAVGPLVRKLAIARFARSYAALYHAGISPSTGLLAAAESASNGVLLRNCQRIAPALERGASISQCMTLLHFFPPMFTGMVATGEQTGSMDAMLDKAAEYYENEAVHAAMQLVVILGVMLLLAMAAMVAVRVVAFYSGYASGVSAAGSE